MLFAFEIIHKFKSRASLGTNIVTKYQNMITSRTEWLFFDRSNRSHLHILFKISNSTRHLENYYAWKICRQAMRDSCVCCRAQHIVRTCHSVYTTSNTCQTSPGPFIQSANEKKLFHNTNEQLQIAHNAESM